MYKGDINMQYDRKIMITVGSNRRSANWQPQMLMLSKFYEKLRISARSTETMAEYLTLKKVSRMTAKTLAALWQTLYQGLAVKLRL